MKLERVELFLVRLPLKRAYETSGARETHMTRVLCRVESEGAVGWGESVAGEVPWYSGETPRTVLYALEEFILPELFKADLSAPQDVDEKLAWIREHRMAKATVEMAVWDLFAKRAGKPLSVLLGGTRDRILCGVAIGIQPSIEALMDTIRRELEGGYQRVKLKIKPGLEVEIAEATRRTFPDLAFMLDANSAYTLRDAPLFKRIDPTRPMMIEQPLAHDDLIDHAALQREIKTPICLDESIHSGEDARAGRRARFGEARARRLRRARRARVVRRDARDGHRPGAQRASRVAPELPSAGRCLRLGALLRHRDHR